jgi:protein-S-isoprenylcysteine O-methyltransferase Ste14
MPNPVLSFIILCYVIIAVVWIISAFTTKKTVEKRGGWAMRIIAILVIIGIILFQKFMPIYVPWAAGAFWPPNMFASAIAMIVTALGAATMLWARYHLGRNWSGNVTFKEDHKLITSGPYAYIRHPIYSGLVLMFLGTAIYNAHVDWFLIFMIFFIGAHYKAGKEEKLMAEHFPAEYAEYKKRTGALVPFI